jgi:hypothetical protein
MNDEIYDDVAIERACRDAFNLKLTITEVIVRNVSTGYTSTATVFKTSPTNLYVYITSEGTLVLADVQKIIRNMNMDADAYLPPHADVEYFERIGIQKFKSMFPGKHIMGADDTRYYQTLAPYSPALVRIAKVKGDIRTFHFESKLWRKVKDYAFNKIVLVQ